MPPSFYGDACWKDSITNIVVTKNEKKKKLLTKKINKTWLVTKKTCAFISETLV